jgi:hypothetical protein
LTWTLGLRDTKCLLSRRVHTTFCPAHGALNAWNGSDAKVKPLADIRAHCSDLQGLVRVAGFL